MSKTSPKTFADVRAAFENRSILNASRRELEELLAAAVCERSDDAAERAQLQEMTLALRQFIANRRGVELRRPSGVAIFALFLLGAALVWCGTQAYSARRATVFPTTEMAEQMQSSLATSDVLQQQTDSRGILTIAELASRAPSLRNGSVQAWWAGEQARQVQRLEAEAKRQALAGDYDGAARSVSRANEIRSGIPALANFERPQTH